MNFILDTSALIEVENGNEEIIKKILDLKKTSQTDLAITIFTFCEFYYGFLQKNEKHKQKAPERLHQYTLLQTTERSGQIFCELLSQIKKMGLTITQFDLFIASLAIEHGYTLLTLDQDFEHIPGLKKIILRF